MYVPAFDPFHTIFRMLYILKRFDGNETVEVDRLRIYDFYLLFPYLANKISLKSDEKQLKDSRRKFIPSKITPYNYISNSRRIFERLHPYQMIALSHLASYGLIDPEMLLQQKVSVTDAEKMHQVMSQLDVMSPEDANVLSWLMLSFRNTPLNGVDGLKYRTKLIESKYDGC